MKEYDKPNSVLLEHDDIYDFKARELPLTSYHCISFKSLNKSSISILMLMMYFLWESSHIQVITTKR